MVPGVMMLITICCKYNAHNVLYFIVTDNSGSTQAGIPCLYQYPYQFTNFSILHVDCSLVMYKFFGAVNQVDSQNKSRQSDLVLEKF